MPNYVARCDVCKNIFKYSSTISERNDPVPCSCGQKSYRDYEAELNSVGDRQKWITSNERWSRSMGVPVASLAEYRKKYPNSTYSSDGRLLIKSRSDKLRQAKERGFCELDNK